MTDDERLARNMAKLDAQRAIRDRAIAAAKSQRETAAGKRDEYGNPPTRKRPARNRPTRQGSQRPSRAATEPTPYAIAVQKRRARVVALYLSGMSAPQVAAQEDMGATSVYDHLRAAGVQKRTRSEEWLIKAEKRFKELAGDRASKPGAPVDVDLLAEMYGSGATVAEIAKIVGVVPSAVYKRLARAGVEMRKPGWRVAA